MLTTRLRPAAVVAASLLLTLTACGGSEDDAGAGGSGDMAGMEMSAMNDPDATPADEVDGDREKGEFVVLDTAPPGSDEVAGEAFLAQDDSGTTVTIRLIGLEPGVDYVSHLHDAGCAEGDGGDHFKFDPDGGDVPPNEVHLGFTATEQGTGQATVTNDQRVEDGAPSIVVHPAEATDNRLACADFS
ncbi:superoxide dismutase family protein [Nocardioides sp. AX2bis]|uniref:superoxide dismutase family protein n=1 Tax=Nocardioides sp. AX2bis TaxID=2653157 RepID=UPI0012EFD7D5|nr:superoxide dismutase family protein [Nocardioides sp. AX2bis]VXC43389.1 Superoxide dismutase [Nocardioides sp. AX2bis]